MPLQVFRAKGILWFEVSELRHIFQLSGSRYDLKVDKLFMVEAIHELPPQP